MIAINSVNIVAALIQVCGYKWEEVNALFSVMGGYSEYKSLASLVDVLTTEEFEFISCLPSEMVSADKCEGFKELVV
jgi:hypothetical protein